MAMVEFRRISTAEKKATILFLGNHASLQPGQNHTHSLRYGTLSVGPFDVHVQLEFRAGNRVMPRNA